MKEIKELLSEFRILLYDAVDIVDPDTYQRLHELYLKCVKTVESLHKFINFVRWGDMQIEENGSKAEKMAGQF